MSFGLRPWKWFNSWKYSYTCQLQYVVPSLYVVLERYFPHTIAVIKFFKPFVTRVIFQYILFLHYVALTKAHRCWSPGVSSWCTCVAWWHDDWSERAAVIFFPGSLFAPPFQQLCSLSLLCASYLSNGKSFLYFWKTFHAVIFLSPLKKETWAF